jgi:hypothetical protein
MSTIPLTPKDHAEAIALFRAEIVGSLVRRELEHGDLRRSEPAAIPSTPIAWRPLLLGRDAGALVLAYKAHGLEALLLRRTRVDVRARQQVDGHRGSGTLSARHLMATSGNAPAS